jgi:DNA-directed RNA polymerase subunit RPC12/RpoP
MTRYTDRHHTLPNKDIVVVGNEYNKDAQREYICNYCQRTLSRLIDYSGENPSLYCSYCSIEVIPEIEKDLRAKSKLEVPDGSDIEPSVSYPPDPNDINRNKDNELKGTFRALQDRGIKITDYKERGWRKKK